MTVYKLFNLCKLSVSHLLSSAINKNIHFGNPFSISVEPTNHCNLKCPECPTGNNSMSRNKGMLSLELFEKIVERNHKYLITLTLYFQGEPYLHNSFFEYIKFAKSYNIYTITSTNAHYLNKENAIKTIESGLDRIIISLDGHNQETYSQYRKTGDFNKVIEGINNLVYWKKKLKSKKPYIIIQHLLFSFNEHFIDDFKAVTSTINAEKIEFKTAQLYDFQNGHSLMPKTKRFSRYKKLKNGSYSLKRKQRNKCFRMWSTSVITYDGKVIPCCFDKDLNHTMGDVNHKSLYNIWHNKQYTDFRKQVIYQRKNIDICCNCSE